MRLSHFHVLVGLAHLFFQRVQLRIAEDLLGQDAGNRRLFDHLAIVTAMQPMKDIADRARLFDQSLLLVDKIRAGHNVVDADGKSLVG